MPRKKPTKTFIDADHPKGTIISPDKVPEGIRPPTLSIPSRRSKYDPGMCEELINHCKTGLSVRASLTKMGVLHITSEGWSKRYPEWRDAIRFAKECCVLWWEEVGISGVFAGKEINTGIWIFGMKNHSDWVDKKEAKILGHDGGSIKVEGRTWLDVVRAAAPRLPDPTVSPQYAPGAAALLEESGAVPVDAKVIDAEAEDEM